MGTRSVSELHCTLSTALTTGRAQGIGYLQELIARLTHQYIYTSNTSVNSSLDNNPTTFPLDQKFHMDMSHDDILIS
jgi:hypothetical protein